MKRLNRGGYLTIEIVLASVMTFVIAFFLIDITIKLVDNADNAYADTVLTTDKALIIKNIKENLKEDICSKGIITNVGCSNNECNIRMTDNSLVKLSVNNNKVEYTGNESYSKDIDKILTDINLTTSSSKGYYNFKISGTNIFVDENYDMNIFVYNEC